MPAPEARRGVAQGTPFLIGELAQRTGRSVHAIRWYESQGLVPGVVRDAGGRRLYGEPHIGWLDLMDRLRRTGMSIAEMREYTALALRGRATLAERRALLAAHRERVNRTIAEWKRALSLVDRKIDFYDAWIESGQRPPLIPTGEPEPALPPRQPDEPAPSRRARRR
ncbi:MerR family transcriptional regulator [Variovorax paradoxus]|jgi:DNA-binding transcriptional MerR regulator|uniref:MerR family transcriptional regulator n=1 Tax=Variovorax TaxID=34072 RepID=UPI0006E6AA5B|nr:MerR family transcriptional regulator [Variovorax paradoxus]KPV02996.1 MerR family transcriptional regulator [Variovorax paradoxus]KPV04205.1 MerR family transcriptional regulator [Variovorax paradoxus]KPV17306.1 MerR family transcriptional regulator [Variovorax paradoxus]KPV26227.1 MerR family transcriptional regulator [Variovorax paradoxus]